MLVQIKKSFPSVVKDAFNDFSILIDDISRNHASGPFELDDKRAAKLIKEGKADAVFVTPQSTAQRAVAPKLDAQRR